MYILLQVSQVAQWERNHLPMQETRSSPVSGRYLGEGKGNPVQYSCQGNAWQATMVHRVAKYSDTT